MSSVGISDNLNCEINLSENNCALMNISTNVLVYEKTFGLSFKL